MPITKLIILNFFSHLKILLIQFFNHNLKKAIHHLSEQHLQSFLGLETQRVNISRKDWNNFYKEFGEYKVGPLILQTPRTKFTWKNILQVFFFFNLHYTYLTYCVALHSSKPIGGIRYRIWSCTWNELLVQIT